VFPRNFDNYCVFDPPRYVPFDCVTASDIYVPLSTLYQTALALLLAVGIGATVLRACVSAEVKGDESDDDECDDDQIGDHASMRGSKHDHHDNNAKTKKAKGDDSNQRSAARAIALARAVCAHIDLLDALALASDFLGHAALQSIPVPVAVPVASNADAESLSSSSATKRLRGAASDHAFDETHPSSSSSSFSSSSFAGEPAAVEPPPPPTAEMQWATDIQAGIDALFGTSLLSQHDLIRRAFGGSGERSSKKGDRTAAAAASPFSSSSSSSFSSSSSSFSSSSPSIDEDAEDSDTSADRPLHGAYHLPVALLAWACQARTGQR
jgi:hypothetical protein